MTSLPIEIRKPLKPFTRQALEDFPHRGGIIVHPGLKWIWLKPGKTGGTSIIREGLPPNYLADGSDYTPIRWHQWREGMTDAQLARYRIWTIVRNPWERLLSCLAYFSIDVDEFCADPIAYISPGVWLHIMPQHIYSDYCHIVGRFETLQDSYEAIARELRWRPNLTLPWLNRSEHPDASEVWSLPSRRRVADMLVAADAAALGYEREEPPILAER